MEARLLSVDQAAERLGANAGGVSKFTVRSWLRSRKLAHVRLGRRVLIPVEALEAFIRENTVPADETPSRAARATSRTDRVVHEARPV